MLTKLKIALVGFPSLSFTSATAPDPKELLLTRETYELATLLAVRAEDTAAFERYLTQAKGLYSDYSAYLPRSERQDLLLGLNLLFLLSQNRLPEFHTELERLPSDRYRRRPRRCPRCCSCSCSCSGHPCCCCC